MNQTKPNQTKITSTRVSDLVSEFRNGITDAIGEMYFRFASTVNAFVLLCKELSSV